MDLLGTLGVKLTTDTTELSQGFRESAAMMTRFQSQTEQMSARLNSVMGLVLRATPLAAMTAAVHGYAEEEMSIQKLTSAVGLYGAKTDNIINPLKKFAEEVHNTTLLTHEQVEAAMAQGIRMGIHTADIQKVTQSAIGLSKIMGVDLSSAMMQTVRAAEGFTQGLRRHGIVLNQNLSKEQQYQQLLKMGAAAYGMAEDEVHTLSGEMTQSKKASEELAVAFGKLMSDGLHIPELFRALAEKTKEWTDKLNSADSETKALIRDALVLVVTLPLLAKGFTLVCDAIIGSAIAANWIRPFMLGIPVLIEVFGTWNAVLMVTRGILMSIATAPLVVAGAAVAAGTAIGKLADKIPAVDKFHDWLSEGMADTWVGSVMGWTKQDNSATAHAAAFKRQRMGIDKTPANDPTLTSQIDQQHIDNLNEFQKQAEKAQESLKMELAQTGFAKWNVLMEKSARIAREMQVIATADPQRYGENKKYLELREEHDRVAVEAQKQYRQNQEMQRAGEKSLRQEALQYIMQHATYQEKLVALQSEYAKGQKDLARIEAMEGGAKLSDKWYQQDKANRDLESQIAEQKGKGVQATRFSPSALMGTAEAYKVEIGGGTVQAQIAQQAGTTAKNTGAIAELVRQFMAAFISSKDSETGSGITVGMAPNAY